MKISQTMKSELEWLGQIIETRLKLYFGQDAVFKAIEDIQPPALNKLSDNYSNFVNTKKLGFADRVLLAISLVPLLQPQMFDMLMIRNSNTDKRFVEFGGVTGTHFSGILPTLDTLLFILAGSDVQQRLACLSQFNNGHHLFKHNLLSLERGPAHEPLTSAIIHPTSELLEGLMPGRNNGSEYSIGIPAKKITTQQTWNDLILEDTVMNQIEEIGAWVKHGHRLHTELGLGSKLSPGHRCLFYGASGTGKTLTATLIGKLANLPVYRIDLSMLVSKYIGETEKNLEQLFTRAEDKNWVLFFDEADALFGKRTNVRDAHDKYANQEVSYLLQRVEEYHGLVILATNFKSNIDDAFARRFQTAIHFPIPKVQQRKKLWMSMLPEKLKLDNDINVDKLAEQYELSGGSIINIVRFCSLMALARNRGKIILPDVMEGIKREFVKEGKAM
ncbi:MAG: ATP-binding protein [Flavipsychrobacter sp.]|jgi:hypothetical protein|nr:ATP-binding protein [Flavipsychrobacter sp.]